MTRTDLRAAAKAAAERSPTRRPTITTYTVPFDAIKAEVEARWGDNCGMKLFETKKKIGDHLEWTGQMTTAEADRVRSGKLTIYEEPGPQPSAKPTAKPPTKSPIIDDNRAALLEREKARIERDRIGTNRGNSGCLLVIGIVITFVLIRGCGFLEQPIMSPPQIMPPTPVAAPSYGSQVPDRFSIDGLRYWPDTVIEHPITTPPVAPPPPAQSPQAPSAKEAPSEHASVSLDDNGEATIMIPDQPTQAPTQADHDAAKAAETNRKLTALQTNLKKAETNWRNIPLRCACMKQSFDLYRVYQAELERTTEPARAKLLRANMIQMVTIVRWLNGKAEILPDPSAL